MRIPETEQQQSPIADPIAGSADADRGRLAKACSACSRQKVRCDGAQPCTRCCSVGLTDQCIYLPSMRGKIKRRKTKPSKDASCEPSHRMQTTQAGTNNSALWDTNASTSGSVREAEPLSAAETSPTASLARGQTAATLDKLTTTLPQNGDAHNPLSVLVELSEAASSRHSYESPTSTFQASASKRQREEDDYYAPLERTLKEEAPHIMALINTHEAKQLFDVYFTHLHPYLPMLDKEQSAPGAVARRNNFLFNAICCSAARAHNVVLWARLKDFARFEMERLPREKNLDVVQGHLIYAWWNLIRPTRFEQDMTWLRVGIASRTAIDIALHRVGLLAAAREGLPAAMLKTIVRTWLLCFVVDRTLCVQLGKPSGSQWEWEAAKYVEYLRDPSGDKENLVYPTQDDIWVAALVEWSLILSRAVEAFRLQALQTSVPSGSHGFSNDLPIAFVLQLRQWRESWIFRWTSCSRSSDMPSNEPSHFEVYEYYACLVIQSLALQFAQDRSPLTLPSTFLEYQSSAMKLVQTIEGSRKNTRMTRSLPDFVHTATTYAATSLLRCTQAKFAHLRPDRSTIFEYARKASALLAEAAIDSDHIAAVQSALISRLIAARDVVVDETAWSTSSLPFGTSPTTRLGRPLEAVDFGDFARAVNDDQNMTFWPPLPPLYDSTGDNQRPLIDQPVDGLLTASVDGQGSSAAGAMPGDLASWVTRQGLNATGPVTGLDEFLTASGPGSEAGFFSDPTWQSLLQNNPFGTS